MSHSLTMLMIETEQPEGLSARKLVIETAKHNVLTAYSAVEGFELLRRFPAVDAVLVHALLPDCEQVIAGILDITPGMPVIVASPAAGRRYKGASHVVPSHQPGALLHLLADQFGASIEN